ncbi:MAG: FMN-binding protein [Acholeplasmataceae bacterium]|nr:FMN-binding protein [Acholeplasmataceae bacterium]
MKRKILRIIGILFALFIIGMVITMLIMNKKVQNLEIGEIDLETVADGTYEGEYTLFPVTVVVKVTVEDHEIKNIEIIRHDNGQGEKAEAITTKVIDEQSLQVDIISGATYSCKTILKAVENALSK